MTENDNWDGELTATRHDPETGALFVIAVDSTRRGPAAGGTRASVYAAAGDAVADARRLASAMSLKMAVCDLPMGGGKSVIALPRSKDRLSPQEWSRMLQLHAENIEMLGGHYFTGPDVNTTAEDMDVIGRRTRHVFGRSPAAGGVGSSAPTTALGVHAVMTATAGHLGWGGLADRTVLVQGYGAVGADLADRLAEDGARVSVVEADPARAQRAGARGFRVVEGEELLRDAFDVYAPCALGGVVDGALARRIPVHAIVGAANNVLVDDEAAGALLQRGIVYAPDFIANAGGALHLVGREVLGWGAEEVAQRARGLADVALAAYALSERERISTDAAARRIAADRMAVAA